MVTFDPLETPIKPPVLLLPVKLAVVVTLQFVMFINLHYSA